MYRFSKNVNLSNLMRKLPWAKPTFHEVRRSCKQLDKVRRCEKKLYKVCKICEQLYEVCGTCQQHLESLITPEMFGNRLK